MTQSYVVNASWIQGMGLGLWLEATSAKDYDKDSKVSQIGKLKVSVHPFVGDLQSLGSFKDSIDKIQNLKSEPTLGWFNLRLPVVSPGIPKPNPLNWIELDLGQKKKSGIEVFAIPVLILPSTTTISQISEIIYAIVEQSELVNLSVLEKDLFEEDKFSFDLVLSSSLIFVKNVLGFIRSFIERGRFIPSVDSNTEANFGSVISWKTMLDRIDQDRANLLAQDMPSELYSYISLTQRNSQSPTPLATLQNMTNSYVDSTIREILGEHRYELFKDIDFEDSDLKPSDLFCLSLWQNDAQSHYNFSKSRLEEIVLSWQERTLRHLEPAHLSLRLIPPDSNELSKEQKFSNPVVQQNSQKDLEVWFVEYGLQSSEVEDYFISSSDLWNDKVNSDEFGIEPAQAKLLLLRKLRAASEFSPEISKSLTQSKPLGFELDISEVINFLKTTAPVLAKQEAVKLSIPHSLKDQLKPRVKFISTPSAAKSMLGLGAIFDFKAEVFIGDRQVSIAELKQLLKEKNPLVKIDNEWLFLDHQEIEAALDIYQSKTKNKQRSLGSLLGESMQDLNSQSLVEVQGLEPLALIKSLESTKSDATKEFVEPVGFLHPLRDYQRRGVQWLLSLERIGLGACLADDMGLGKTAQIIALIAHDHTLGKKSHLRKDQHKEQDLSLGQKEELKPTSTTLVVAPVSVVNNWKHEINRFYPELKVYVHYGPNRLEGIEFAKRITQSDVVITSYSVLSRDVAALSSISWARVVLDEAQNIKNPGTNAARAAFSLSAYSKLALTGTPVENNTSELWSIMNFINPGLLGTRTSFRTKFGLPIERYGDEDVAQSLASGVAPFILRRMKTDKSIISDLPEKIEIKEYCSLSDEQTYLYQQVLAELENKLEDLSSMARRGAILGAITKLKQLCNHPAALLKDSSPLAGRSGKLERLEEILSEVLEVGEKVIVFTQFTNFGYDLQSYLQQRFHQRIPFLKGNVSLSQRDQMVAEFQLHDGPSIFLLSTKAGGAGLNLTAANHVVHFDRWWNSAVEAQASDRAFRIGQRKDVIVRKLISEKTLEEKIDAVIEAKKELSQRLVSGGEVWITEMSNNEVLDVLSLSDAS